jgi:hypothetical protein
MLETLQKATPEDNPDTKFLVEALDKVKVILGELDRITGFEENKLSLETLNDMIVWKDKEDQTVCPVSSFCKIFFFFILTCFVFFSLHILLGFLPLGTGPSIIGPPPPARLFRTAL